MINFDTFNLLDSYLIDICFAFVYGTNQLQLKRYTRMKRNLHACHTHLKLLENAWICKICDLRVLSYTCTRMYLPVTI